MADFTIEQLRKHFGSDLLIGRVRNLGKGFARIAAFRENGERWRYPDGQLVNDILFAFEGEAEYEKGDWVLIRGYEINDESDRASGRCRLRALGLEPLQEVGTLRDLLGAESLIPKRRLLSGAIRAVRVVGDKALILQSYLQKERRRIEREIAQGVVQREQDLQEREKLLAAQEQELRKREKRIKKCEEELAKREQDIRELQEILLPTKATKAKRESPVPPYQFASEHDLVAHVNCFVQESGFHYDEWILENFYTCLKADYLVILAGISGAGKSKLPQLFAKAIGGEFELIPVRPDWNDDRDLLGFFNVRTRQYQSTRFVEFLIQANEDTNRLYIVCLDEMNLAPVEYYFAQLLSVLESDNPRLRPPDEALTPKVVDRFQERAYIEIERLQEEKSGTKGAIREAIDREISLQSQRVTDLERYQDIPIPKNIRFVGTVNVDHTTHGFSDKVLDRANVIQFERVNLGASLSEGRPEAKGLTFQQFSSFCEIDLSPEQDRLVEKFVSQLRQINQILEPSGMSIGFRILREVKRYMSLAIQGDYFADPKVAFDFQVKQRVLPKIRGMQSAELRESLEGLAEFLRAEGYSHSYEKVAGRSRGGGKKRYGGMLQQLEGKGYVNYWEVR